MLAKTTKTRTAAAVAATLLALPLTAPAEARHRGHHHDRSGARLLCGSLPTKAPVVRDRPGRPRPVDRGRFRFHSAPLNSLLAMGVTAP